MTKLYVSYRGEFGAEVEVEDTINIMAKVDKAIKKFERGECKIEVLSELHQSFFEVSDVKTEQVLYDSRVPE